MRIDEIISNFELLDEWEDRYRYLIELGRSLDGLAEAERTQRYVDFIDAEQTRKATLSVVAVTPAQKKKILAIIASAEKK